MQGVHDQRCYPSLSLLWLDACVLEEKMLAVAPNVQNAWEASFGNRRCDLSDAIGEVFLSVGLRSGIAADRGDGRPSASLATMREACDRSALATSRFRCRGGIGFMVRLIDGVVDCEVALVLIA